MKREVKGTATSKSLGNTGIEECILHAYDSQLELLNKARDASRRTAAEMNYEYVGTAGTLGQIAKQIHRLQRS
jgi:predicted nucleic acid-binding protein